ncbi:MAG: cadherin-like domain-containing protein, partial [Anaerolineaceae bacterium]|nr:cadherin-like domain-containing protein [Anaerolineaceae bacterium]
MIFSNTRISIVSAATLFTFAGYESENISFDSAYWDLTASDMSGGALTMTDLSGSAQAMLDVSSIAAAIDDGQLEIAFSVTATIDDEGAPEELDDASAVIGFSPTAVPTSSVTLTRGQADPGAGLALTSGASIPPGTRYISLTLNGIGAGGANTAAFTAPSLIIHDAGAPGLSFSLSPSGWTNAAEVQVTITATDSDSGIEGIYDAEDQPVSATGSYVFNTAVAGSWTFYAVDRSGKVSDNLTAVVDQIDRDPPPAPVLNVSTTEWSNTAVTFTLSAVTAGDGESPVARQYRLNGGEWQAYTAETSISDQGSNLLEARAIDAAGNASTRVSETLRVDTSAPHIDLSASPHPRPAGGATITVTATDDYTSVAQQKVAGGSQSLDFFTGGGGADLASSTYEALASGVYTFYAVDALGNAAVAEITINTYPGASTVVDQSVDEDQTLEVTFQVEDDETPAADLLVSAGSDNPALLPDPVVEHSDANVKLTLAPVADGHGSAAVTVDVEDAGGLVTSFTFNITVNPINDDPQAVDDVDAATEEDTPVEISVLANDSDIDGDSLTVVAVSDPPHGTATITGGGQTVTYTPDADYTGSDAFTYTLRDAGLVEKTATVDVAVGAVNDAPVIGPVENVTVDEDSGLGPVYISLTDVDSPQGDLTLTASSSRPDVI